MVLGRITVKRVAKWSAGRAAVIRAVAPTGTDSSPCLRLRLPPHCPASGSSTPPGTTGTSPPATLERQITALARSCEIVPLAGLRARLSEQRTPAKPLVALTFDDGFSNVVRHALPVLRRYGVSATLFPVTAHVGSDEPMGFDRWAVANQARVERDAWRAVTWSELETWVAAGMELGAHSHRHLNGRDCGTGRALRGGASLAGGTHETASGRRRVARTPIRMAARGSATCPSHTARRLAPPVSSRRSRQTSVSSTQGPIRTHSPGWRRTRWTRRRCSAPRRAGALAPYAILDRLRRADRA